MVELAEKKNVLICITGSIAAYKAVELCRLLIKRGYNVRCVMTESAQKFVTRVTLETITGFPVLCELFEDEVVGGIGHIEAASWADAAVVCPATANIIAKIAQGFADCSVSTTLLATQAQLVLCPAMNVNMYNNEAVQKNLQIIRDRGAIIVDPENGELACGWEGVGRLPHPKEIFHYIRRALSVQDYDGMKVVITAGPTQEAIDPVRFLSNRSSGKMGIALAREAFRRGAEVVLVHGPIKVKVPKVIKSVPVTTACEMHEAVLGEVFEGEKTPDVLIMSAAVSDFRPEQVSPIKIKKDIIKGIKLVQNPDILADVGRKRSGDRPILVGFAVETGELEDLIDYARQKMVEKNADIIVGNFANDALELDTNRVWIISKSGKETEVATTYKGRVANKILDATLKELRGG